MRTTLLITVALAAVGLGSTFMPAVRAAEAEPATRPPGASIRQQAPEDEPLEAYRRELLALAMDAATKLPIVPHLKSRSRAQHQVARAALELNQPRLALDYLERIDNWRGALAAEYARYCVRRAHEPTVERYIVLAKAAAELADQDWRREQIYLTIAQTRLLQGDTAPADSFEQHLQTDAFRGRTEPARVERRTADDDDYQQTIERLDKLAKNELYDHILNGSRAYAALYQRHYDDRSRREEIETKLRRAYRTMPGPETIDMLVTLAETAAAHGDFEPAKGFLDEAQAMYEGVAWSAHREYRYEYVSKIARARVKAADVPGARALTDAASRRYHEEFEQVYNLWRADCLRPLAEAYVAIGDAEKAARHYAQAVEAGMVNPNGRPQAEDLAATCTSMALVGFEPSRDLLQRMEQANSRLSSPW